MTELSTAQTPPPPVTQPPAANPPATGSTPTNEQTPPQKITTPSTELKGPPPAPNALIGAPDGGNYGEFKLPDGYTMDDKALGQFVPLAKEIGLSQAGAQKVVDLYNGLQVRAAETWQNTVKGWGDEAKADKEYGGANYAANLAVAQQALKELGSPQLIEVLEYSGLGNHPEVIRFAYKVGKALSEGTVRGGGSPGGERKPAHEVLYGAPKQE